MLLFVYALYATYDIHDHSSCFVPHHSPPLLKSSHSTPLLTLHHSPPLTRSIYHSTHSTPTTHPLQVSSPGPFHPPDVEGVAELLMGNVGAGRGKPFVVRVRIQNLVQEVNIADCKLQSLDL